MRTIELDARNWRTVLDFYNALLAEIGAPAWHGRSTNALVDSMVWGDINSLEPPYTVRVSGLEFVPREVRDEVELVKLDLDEAGRHFHHQKGRSAEVTFEISPSC
jgi:hypothetical protein